MKRFSAILTAATLTFLLALPLVSAFGAGGFTVTGTVAIDASSCTASDGKVELSLDPSRPGASPYDISLDNGRTWSRTGLLRDASDRLAITGLAWGGYALAVRDANKDIVYPGAVTVKGCTFDACSPDDDVFTATAVTDATSYNWTTSLGSIAAGQGTRILELNLAGVTPGRIAEVCVAPQGPGCAVGPTCFNVRVKCAEVCGNGVDDDLDGLTDCDDPDCGRPIANAGPDVTTCPNASITLAATSSGGTGPATFLWSDGLGAGPTVTINAVASKRYTVTVTDTNGCSSTDAVQVTAVDLVPPTFDPFPVATSVECHQLAAVSAVTATDDCGQATVIHADALSPGTCANAYRLVRTYTARDKSGNTRTAKRTITVQDTQRPTFDNIPGDSVAECGATEPTEVASATDTCDGNPVVTVVSTAAPGACAGESTLTRVFTATDACGNAATASQVVTVVDRGVPLLASIPADIVLTCGLAVPTTIPVVTDLCDPQPRLTVGEFSTPGRSSNDYTITRTFIATDACGNTATASQVVTYEYSGIPAWTSVPVGVTLECGTVAPVQLATAHGGCGGSLSVAFTDAVAIGCGPGAFVITRTFSAIDSDGNQITATQTIRFEDKIAPVLIGVPANVTIGCGIIEPTAMPTASDVCDDAPEVTVVRTLHLGSCVGTATIIREFTASDACGNTATASQVITIVNETQPSFASVPLDAAIECGASEPSELPTATDTCDPMPRLTVSTTSRPGSCAGESFLTRVFIASDACGNTRTASQLITVRDRTAPMFAGVPPGLTIECGAEEPTGLPTASDACDDSPSITVVSKAVPGACVGESILTRIFTVTDACGNSSTASQVVTVRDRTRPRLVSVPRNVTIDCGSAEPTTMPQATDACDTAPVVSVVRSEAAGACAGAVMITRVFTATDACGNTATAVQVISIIDRTAPVFTTVPADVSVACGERAETELPTARDACGSGVEITVVELRSDGVSANVYTVTRVFTASDACGNAAVASQVVSYADSGLPTWTSVPAALTILCGEPLPSALATAEDACDGVLEVTSTSTAVSGACAGESVVTRGFSAEDVDGNRITTSQIVTVRDRTAPVLGHLPPPVTIACGQAEPTELPDASDGCGGVPKVSVASSTTPGLCAGESIVTRVFMAEDACGNTATASQVITVRDRVAPVLTSVPAATTIDCESAEPTDLPTLTDSCDPSPRVSVASSTIAGACVGESIMTRLFTATDACGNLATASQVITVRDRSAPVLTGIPVAVTIECGASMPTALPTATDVCDGNPSVRASMIAAAGACTGESTVTRTFTATDACGNQASATQVITVIDRSAPVLVAVPANVTLTCGQASPTALPTASDACSAAVAIAVNEVRTAGTSADNYSITRVFTATDACGNTASASQVVAYTLSGTPQWTVVPAARSIECGAASPTELATAIDGCGGSLVVAVATTSSAGPCAGEAVMTRVFTAADSDGNRITSTQVITLRDRTPPTLAAVPTAATIECGEGEPTDLPSVSDACDPNTRVSVVTTASAGACAGNSVLTRVFTATDACGNTATASQILTVRDRTAPVLSNLPTGLTIECGTPEPTGMPTATDACDGAPALTATNTERPGACGGESIITRVFKATDACGNVVTATQLITVRDRVAPVLAKVPAAATIECGAAEPTSMPTASDQCDPSPTVTVVQTTVSGACAGESITVRVFTATDACGNTATASQVVTVRDTKAPTLTNVPADVRISCGERAPSALPTASDACDPDAVVTVVEARFNGASSNDYKVTRTFTTRDACGNTATASQVVTYVDSGAPVWTFVPANLETACNATPTLVLAEAEDSCDGLLTVTFADTRTAGSCGNDYTLKRTFTASDADGNLITAEQMIAVRDRVAPVFTSVPAAVVIGCGDAVPSLLPSATDACEGEVKVTERRVSAAGACAGESIVTRVFTAVDACGNLVTASQVVTIQDREPPVFEEVAALLELACSESVPARAPSATDACGEVVVTFKDALVAGSCLGNAEVTRVWTATDDCGNASTVSQVIRRVDRGAPTWTEVPPAVSIECGADVPVVLAKAKDLCSGTTPVTYSDRRVDLGCASSYDIVRTFTVSDLCGNGSATTQMISVRDRTAPVITEVPVDISISCEQPLPTNLPIAVDGCQGVVAVVETKEIIAGACASTYTHIRVFTATDACGNKTQARQRVTRTDNTRPVFATTLSDVELMCGAAIPKATVTATDNCDASVKIAYSETVDNSVVSCTGKGVLVRVWTAIDNCGNVATMRQRVVTVDRVAPVMANIPRSVTIDCGAPITGGQPTATDNCSKDVRIFHKDREISQSCGYTIQRTWYAEDGCGNTSTGIQSILVVDKDAPVFETVVNEQIAVACGEHLPAVTLLAKDACDKDLTYAESVLELGLGACPGERLVMRVFTATDDCGNQAVLTQQVTIADRVAPVLSRVPPSVDVACSAYDYSLAQPSATDACGPSVDVKEAGRRTQVNRSGEIFDALLRTWTATDACGNSATATQLLVFSGASARITVNTSAGAAIGSVCVGYEVTLTAPAGGADYLWDNGLKGQSIKLKADVTREYNVSFGGSCPGKARAVITVAPRPEFALAAVPGMCEGQTLNLKVATELTDVSWSGPFGFEATGTSVSLEDMSGMQSGYYYASATADGGCRRRDSVYVTVSVGACAEVCGNGADDDGDGLVDCADPDCNCCSLAKAVLTTECRDNGTPNDPKDDVYAVYAILAGQDIAGKAFRVSGDARLDAIYPGQPVLLGVYPVVKASASYDFTSVVDATCSLKSVQIGSPGACTNTCFVSLVSTQAGECRDGQYDLLVRVRFNNPPGALLINGKRFVLTQTFGEATFTLPRLSCSGKLAESLVLAFEGDGTCRAVGTFDAACPDDACLPIAVELGARP